MCFMVDIYVVCGALAQIVHDLTALRLDEQFFTLNGLSDYFTCLIRQQGTKACVFRSRPGTGLKTWAEVNSESPFE